MKKQKPVFYDTLIINRVKKYLEDNVDKTYLDVNQMTKTLQETYPEYASRKIVAFRLLVEQAYQIVSKSYEMAAQEQSSSDESNQSDLEVMPATSANNVMSNLMTNLYKKQKEANPAINRPTTSEAIDISSEESGDEAQFNGKGAQSNLESVNGSAGKSFASQQNVPTELRKRYRDFPDVQEPKKRKENISPMANSQKSQEQKTNTSNQINNNLAVLRSGELLRKKKYKKEVIVRKSRETFHDIGGMEKTLKEIVELLMHIKSPSSYYALNLEPPHGILIHGPSGCGKTLLANAIAGTLNIPIIDVSATELVAGVSGESEERIREVFEQAIQYAPCLLLIDEIDVISSNRSQAQKEMERRMVSQLISSMDAMKLTDNYHGLLVVGATTRPEVIDPALRRVGRFDYEVSISIPSRKDRKHILGVVCEGTVIDPLCDFDKIAELTPGYVGADIVALVSRAGAIAVKQHNFKQMRAFQAANEKNIPIVDLEDDDDNTVKDNAKKQVENDNENAIDKETTPNSIPTTTNDEKTDSAKETESKEVRDDAKIDDNAMEVDNPKDISEADKENLKNCENSMTLLTDEKDNGEEQNVEHREPLLCEMLNWLENPPDDIILPQDFCITLNDFLEAIKVLQPLAKREGFITVPDVSWDDVGSLHNIREELQLAVLAPVKYPEKILHFGLSVPSGVLLCGPPGCGKTLLAKAIANEAGINFISVKGPELINMYVGESERGIRNCFQRARNSAPCVIFFDEFDSLCPKRADCSDGSSSARVVNQLLTEMDGIVERHGVYILAATNRPDIIDPAILRPGRLDTVLYVGFPLLSDRIDILKATTKNGKRPCLADDVDFVQLATKTDGFTGADLAGLVRQASTIALKESLALPENSSLQSLKVCNKHFEKAMEMSRPSVNAEDRKMYEKLRIKYAAPRDAENTAKTSNKVDCKKK